MKNLIKGVIPSRMLFYYRNLRRRARYVERVNNLPPNVIMSFPKCGRTWLRLIITHAFYFEFPDLKKGSTNFADSLKKLNQQNPQFPLLQMSHDDRPMYKDYRELGRNKSLYKDKKVLFLIRDPRDVMISWYFHLTKRGTKIPYAHMIDASSPEKFITNKVGGLITIIEFYNIWLAEGAKLNDFKILKYEDLRKNPLKEVKEILNFFEIECLSDASLEKSIEYNEFSRLQKREQNNFYKHGALGGKQDISDKEALKVRRGKVGGYVDYLEDKSIRLMDKLIKERLNSIYEY